MGCVGPAQRRAPSAERVLIGEKPGEALFAKAADAISTAAPGIQFIDCAPRDGLHGSSEYKTDMAKLLIRRTLACALKEAMSK
jgi:CO/xanthine dehydrogenase FAD-binding subunit